VIDIDIGFPVFGEVQAICILEKIVVLLYYQLETLTFNGHCHAFEVRRKKVKELLCVGIESLIEPLPLNVLTGPKGGLIVVLRHVL